jgi:alpha-N-arabinofuranosidase
MNENYRISGAGSNPVIGLLLIITFAICSCSNKKTTEISAPVKPVAVVHADQTGLPINPYLYGMFTELLSNYFEKGTWAELLSDRKFFFTVNSDTTRRRARPGFNRWRPVGPDSFIIMDKDNAYVGEHSVKVLLDKNEAHGIKQSGIGLGKDRKYTGRAILKGDAGTRVTVTLTWGKDPGDKESVTLPPLTREFRKYPFGFTAGANTDSARFEITATGTGALNIGATSLMPVDNINGFRPDLIAKLKALNSGIYRWPGGNFMAAYDWREGIGDPDKRPTRYDYSRIPIIDDNDVGTDEYMTMVKLLGIDPYMMVNIGTGDAFSAAQLVEYCNGSVNTPMGKLRAANGHPEPYNIRIWGIGNEMYGQWQVGHMAINHYVIKHKMFADAMRKVDPTIKIVVCGATLYEINTTNRHHRLLPVNARLPYKYGSPEDWNGQLFANDLNEMDYIAEHAYPFYGNAYDTVQQKFVPVRDSLPERVRKTPNRIKAAAEAMYEYQKRFPEIKAKNITYFMDEWSTGGRGFDGALVVALTMHEMFRYTDLYTMSGLTGFPSNISWNARAVVYSPIGLFYKLYREKFGAIPLKISGNSPQKEVQGAYLVDKPEKPSGSDTYPLDVMAALSADKSKMTVSIVNPTYSDQEIDLSFTGVSLKQGGNVYTIKAPSLRSVNRPEREPVVSVVENRLETPPGTFKIPALSINLYEFETN